MVTPPFSNRPTSNGAALVGALSAGRRAACRASDPSRPWALAAVTFSVALDLFRGSLEGGPPLDPSVLPFVVDIASSAAIGPTVGRRLTISQDRQLAADSLLLGEGQIRDD